VTGCDFYQSAADWQGVTFGLVAGFKEWLLQQGFAIASVNRRLSCVRKFCALAAAAGMLSGNNLALIQTVRTIRKSAGLERDKQRARTRIKQVTLRRGAKAGHTRPASKKTKAVGLTTEQAKQLKQQPNTPQGRRDALLMRLLLDQGLRAGEVAALQVTDFQLKSRQVTFWREKVKMEQTHNLTADTYRALMAYLEAGDAPALGPLLRGSRKSGRLDGPGMTTTAISQRVRTLGAAIGITGLSAHDCRHAWATAHGRSGTGEIALVEMGGWTSTATAKRYIAASKIANAGAKELGYALDEDTA
jgi:integrase